jgi:sugar lactone lactonase YvrE
VNKAGAVFVAMRDHVEVFDAAGKRQAAWETPGKDALLTCVAAGNADVFVADAGALAVLRYDAGGRLVSRITGRPALRSPPAASAGEGEPAPGTAADKADDEGFIVPSPYFDVALAGKDRLWIVNPGRRRVELYAFDGSILAHWGKASFKIEGFCGCCNPTHIAVLPSGHLVTSEKGLARIKVYTPGGELASVVAPPAAFAEGTTGLDVAADSRGRIWVLDPVARKVRLFTRKQTAPALEPKP